MRKNLKVKAMPPDSKNLVQLILGKVWPGTDADALVSAQAGKTKTELDEFKSGLDAILKSHRGEEMKDLVYMIDLSKIKDSVGERWDTSLEKIHTKIEGVFKAEVSERDLFIRRDEITYLVVFDGLPLLQGHLKANLISEEIARALLGEGATGLSNIMDVIIDKDGDVKVMNSFNNDSLITDLIEKTNKSRLESATTASYSCPLTMDDIKYIYRPMLVVKNQLISTFVSLPIRQNDKGSFSSGYEVLGRSPSPAEIFELDHLTQHVVAKELNQMITAKSRALVTIPVHFETLSSTPRRMKYLSNIEKVLEDNKTRVIFEIMALPEDVLQSRLIEFTSVLRNHSRALLGQVLITQRPSSTYFTAGLHGVGIDAYNQLNTDDGFTKEMDAFIENAKKNKLSTFIHGVRSNSMLMAAICSGFDYIDGYALTSVVPGNLDIHEFDIRIPYHSYQNKVQNKR